MLFMQGIFCNLQKLIGRDLLTHGRTHMGTLLCVAGAPWMRILMLVLGCFALIGFLLAGIFLPMIERLVNKVVSKVR